MSKKTVIIGGVAGGATAAARLRRKDESMEIIIIERGEYISYANCGLPYYIGDIIKSRDALLLQTPKEMKQKFNIDVRILNEAIEILPAEKIVRIKKLKTGEAYEETYDNLVLATGSSPLQPPIPGIDASSVFKLWTIPDMDAINAFIKNRNAKSAVVVGGGFIGLEMAENLHAAGLSVTIAEMQDQVMGTLDFEMANLLHENLRMNQVELCLGDGVKSFSEGSDGTVIELQSGKQILADIVLLSIGVRPNSALAAGAGLALNRQGGIMVDSHLKTSAPDIYAVGDVIEVNHFVSGQKTMIPLAGPANKQARILADNLCGAEKVYEGSMGTSVARVFDLTAASAGLNEKQLAAAGEVKNKDYYTALINQKSHAGYYPEATQLTLKILFRKDGSILGAQAVGQEGVDKRIDTIAVTMRLGGTVYDLEALELAYAPPFSSAKDPVNMLGFTAENILEGMVRFIDWDELDRLTEADRKESAAVILDITEDMERMVYEIPGSYHIPLGQLRSRMGELDKEKRIIVYCAVGVRSYNAARILMQSGFSNVEVLAGGTSFYKSMHHMEKANTGTSNNVVIEREKPMVQKGSIASDKEVRILDCCGMQCPGPIMKVHAAIEEMNDAEVLQVSATDMGFANDIESWCRRTGNTLLKAERRGKENIVFIRKGIGEAYPAAEIVPEALPQGKTIIVFSGDLDRALASFIIANGAAAMGRPVTMFFTFWGLNILRKADAPGMKKPFMDKMFGMMMPKGSKKLKLSKMNMAGMGTSMMKKVMQEKNVDSLEVLMKNAMENGVKLVACTMSMDIMGLKKEELIDGITYAGVASYLGDAEESNVNLFI